MPCMRRKNNRKSAFTLVEMLIVTAILSVVGMAIYATFNSGVKIWQKVTRQLPEEDLNIFFDKFSLDLRNCFKFTGINFSGTADKLEFPTLVNSLRLEKRTVGKSIYAYEPQGRILNRYQVDFAGIYSDEGASPRQSLRDVKALKFQYYFYDEQNKIYVWQDEWLREGLPLAVRVELELDDGQKTKKFSRTVAISIGG